MTFIFHYMHQSIPAAPIPLVNSQVFAHILYPSGGVFENTA